MIVMADSFHSCDVDNLVLSSGTTVKMQSGDICNIGSAADVNILPIIRSVAVSSDIAESDQEEVCHVIHVDSSKSSRLATVNRTDTTYLEEVKVDPPAEYTLSNVHGGNPALSYILPSENDCIVSAIVLSKWDDIMGPQTVHVWLKDEADMTVMSTEDDLCHSVNRNVYLAKSVKYVTVHTVNYSNLNLALSPCSGSDTVDQEQKNSGIFIVPEIDLVAQSLVFQLHNHDLNVLYSLAILVSYQHYNYFLHLRQLCWHWLQRVAARLHVVLLKCLSSNSTFEATDRVNGWMLDMCCMILSLKSYGLAPAIHVQPYHVLNNPLLERVLTSHLQTFGCTVVMGTASEDINSVSVFGGSILACFTWKTVIENSVMLLQLILFLALFLDTDELHCSRLVLPPEKCTFHAGLFLQGLLLNEYGCRELCSLELAENPYPVTTVDLTRGVRATAVKQTPLHHRRWQRYQKEYHLLCEEVNVEGQVHSLHESILHPVKEGASLVCGFLEDLRHLPSDLWLTYIQLFKQKLYSFAFSLLSLVCCLSDSPKQLQHSRHLAQALDLEEADLLIVLAVAEKLQPGIYAFVMGENSLPK